MAGWAALSTCEGVLAAVAVAEARVQQRAGEQHRCSQRDDEPNLALAGGIHRRRRIIAGRAGRYTVLRAALARVAFAGPGSQHQQQPRVAGGAHLVALACLEVRHEARRRRSGPGALPAAADLDLAVDDDQIGALVDLVLLELLGRREG